MLPLYGYCDLLLRTAVLRVHVDLLISLSTSVCMSSGATWPCDLLRTRQTVARSGHTAFCPPAVLSGPVSTSSPTLPTVGLMSAVLVLRKGVVSFGFP